MLAGCSSSAIKKTHSTDQVVARVNLLAVHFFRPDYQIADWDDFSNQNRKLSCETPGDLWKDLIAPEKAGPLILCINRLRETAHYLYIPKAQPFLEADKTFKDPKNCLYTLLPKLALPREVYFQGETFEEKKIEDFAVSFDTKANLVADTELRAPRFEVELRFPLSRRLNNSQDLEIWLLTTVLTLFREEGEMKASLVPDSVVKECFKDDPLYQDKRARKIQPLFWP